MKVKTLITALIIIFLIAILGEGDFQSEVVQHVEYCKMVNIWRSDAKQGIAPEDRNGWPPYHHRINCED